MSNTAKLTSTKYKILYVITYLIYTFLFVASPIITMKFIDSVISKNGNDIIMYSVLCLLFFLLIQLFSYIFSIVVGKVESNNFINFFKNLNIIIMKNDIKKKYITNSELNQQIGQNYEMANSYFFIQPMELIFSLINIVAIFTIMFVISWKIALILLVFVLISFFFSKVFEKKYI